jgi:3-polyprenyl-4-hydroxybenzoate decarboxylase
MSSPSRVPSPAARSSSPRRTVDPRYRPAPRSWSRYVDPTFREAEAPFGEYTGYMGTRVANPVFFVTGITHRRTPVYQAFLSQFPPSESSLIRKLAYDAVYLNRLQSANIPGVLDVQLHEATGSYGPWYPAQEDAPRSRGAAPAVALTRR